MQEGVKETMLVEMASRCDKSVPKLLSCTCNFRGLGGGVYYSVGMPECAQCLKGVRIRKVLLKEHARAAD